VACESDIQKRRSGDWWSWGAHSGNDRDTQRGAIEAKIAKTITSASGQDTRETITENQLP
jgi:hypothetical protein